MSNCENQDHKDWPDCDCHGRAVIVSTEPITVEPNNYAIAKRACELFEGEYLGQQQKALWAWALGKATHEEICKIQAKKVY